MQRLGVAESDLDEQFIRGSGPGGQKINKTSVCVLLQHRPTGHEIRCQQTRSQALNRYYARKLLCERIETELRGAESKVVAAREKIRRQKRKRSKRAKEKMLDQKSRRGEVKKLRRDLGD